MYKEIKYKDSKIFVDLDDVVGVGLNSYKRGREETIYHNLELLRKNGFVSPLFDSQDKEKVEDAYKEICFMLKENKEKADVEKRLRAYIEDIDTQVAKEVKQYLDNLTNR